MQAKPAASLVLLTYNQDATVEAAAWSCLEQKCDPIEIIFSDDASTDDTYNKLCEIADQYSGPHRLRVRQNNKNLGIGAHYSLIAQEASAEFIIVAAGDDVSLPNRVQTLLNTWYKSNSTLDLIASYAMRIDHKGLEKGRIELSQLSQWKNAALWVKKRPYVIGATFAFTKKLFEQFGPIAPGVDYEDQVLSLRAATLGSGLTLTEPLLLYREGGVSFKQNVGPEKLREQATKKYARQLATYLQISHDLKLAGEERLAQKVQHKYIQRSQACLLMIEASPYKSLYSLLSTSRKACPQLSTAWLISKAVMIKFPQITFWLRKSI